MTAARLAVRARDVRKLFGERVVLDHLDLDIAAGEFVAMLGKSGTGKTTFLRALAGLEPLDAGQLLVPPVRTIVFQEPRLISSKRVHANVMLGQKRSRENRDAALSALAEVGLSRHAEAWPTTLSGGEAQRVALARALVRRPDLMLLDEPFAALDALTRLAMQDLVVDLCRRHAPAALIVTHDVDEAIMLADRVVVLSAGRISLDLPVEVERPRRRENSTFAALRHRLLTELGVGVSDDQQSGEGPLAASLASQH